MSLRMVAGETSRLCRSTSALEPTGSFVETKSSTMARKTASFLSSSTQPPPPWHSWVLSANCMADLKPGDRSSTPRVSQKAYIPRSLNGRFALDSPYLHEKLQPSWRAPDNCRLAVPQTNAGDSDGND